MQTILGAGGSIGIALAESLTAYTHDIRLVSRNPKKVNDTDTLFAADLTDHTAIFDAVKGSEIVYVTVGFEYSLKVWQALWLPFIQNVVDACVEHQAKLVFFDNVYMIGGDNVRHITEASPVSPVSKKGEIRAAVNKVILDQVAAGKLTAIIARAADFYGAEGNKSMLMELIYKPLSQGKKAQWIFDATKNHSFTYTPDAGKGTAMLGNTPEAYNQIWNLPTDKTQMTGTEFAEFFAAEMGSTKKGVQVLPKWLVRILGIFVPFLGELPEMAYQYDRDYFFDSSKFDTFFNFKPTTYQDGIRATLAALKTQAN